MQTADRIDTTPFAPEDPASPSIPCRISRRRVGSIPGSRCDMGYVVHEYQAIRDLTLMDEIRPSLDTITEFMGAKGTRWGDFMDNLMLAKTGRNMLACATALHLVHTTKCQSLAAADARAVSELLDEWAAEGQFDFAEFAAYFPIRVMFGLIGACRRASRYPPLARDAGSECQSHPLAAAGAGSCLSGALEFRRRALSSGSAAGGGGEDDVLNRSSPPTPRAIDEDELHIMLIFLFAAGYDTSKNMLTLIMHVMLQHPQEWARCADDRPFCDHCANVPLHSVSNLYRMSKKPSLYRDVMFPANTLFLMPLTFAGRDPQLLRIR